LLIGREHKHRKYGGRGERCTIMNKFGRFIGRISSEISLKMDYFGSKSPKIAKRWGLCPQIPCLQRLRASLPDPRLD